MGTYPGVKERLDALGRRWPWLGTILAVQERFSELNGNYLASAVTLAAFLSLFPLLLVVLAVVGFFSHSNGHLAGDIISNLGLKPHTQAAENIVNAITGAERHRAASGIVGLAGLFWSGLGLVAAVQYALNTVWQVKGRGFKDKGIGLAWLAGAFVIFGGSFFVTAALNFLPGLLAAVGILVGLAVDIALWLWTMKVMANRDVGWRSLLPGAVLGGVGFEVLKALGSFWVPRAVSHASALYGSLGVVFATLAWLLFFGRLIVYSSVLNVVRWEARHGTVTVEIDLPRLPGTVPLSATRSGEAAPKPEVTLPERVT